MLEISRISTTEQVYCRRKVALLLHVNCRLGLQHGTQFKLWAGIDPRPGLGYRVIAREVIPAGSFVYEYAGHYLPVGARCLC